MKTFTLAMVLVVSSVGMAKEPQKPLQTPKAAQKMVAYKVTATVMTNAAGKKLANNKKNDANTRVFAALPSRKALGKLITVFSPVTGKQVRNVPVHDVGPHSIKDPYWLTGSRPLAEKGLSDKYGKAKNTAGIDLSLKLCHALGLKFPYKGPVYWRFEESIEVASR